MSFIAEKVTKITKKHKTNNPFEIAERLNIIVHKLPLHDEINGFYKVEKRNRFIIINSNLSLELQRFVCAHELGHAILHPRLNTSFLRKNTFYSIDRIEREANEFAVELLIPNDDLYAYKDSNLSIYEVCEQYSVPRELAYIKNF